MHYSDVLHWRFLATALWLVISCTDGVCGIWCYSCQNCPDSRTADVVHCGTTACHLLINFNGTKDSATVSRGCGTIHHLWLGPNECVDKSNSHNSTSIMCNCDSYDLCNAALPVTTPATTKTTTPPTSTTTTATTPTTPPKVDEELPNLIAQFSSLLERLKAYQNRTQKCN